MLNTPLQIQETSFLTEYHVPVLVQRVRALVDFEALDGSLVSYSCLVDSGAPVCVIPYSLWHDRNLKWTLLGTQLTQNGVVVAKALQWLGVDCHLCATRVHLVNLTNQTRVGPFLVIGKFAQARLPRAEIEGTSVLGVNFLTENYRELFLSGLTGQLGGHFS